MTGSSITRDPISIAGKFYGVTRLGVFDHDVLACSWYGPWVTFKKQFHCNFANHLSTWDYQQKEGDLGINKFLTAMVGFP